MKVVLEQKCKNRSHNPTKKWSSINDTILIKSFKEKYLGHSIYQRQFYCIFCRKSNKCRDIDIHKMAIDTVNLTARFLGRFTFILKINDCECATLIIRKYNQVDCFPLKVEMEFKSDQGQKNILMNTNHTRLKNNDHT